MDGTKTLRGWAIEGETLFTSVWRTDSVNGRIGAVGQYVLEKCEMACRKETKGTGEKWGW